MINSLSGKTLDKYRELYGIIVDFFNLFSSNDMDLVSITGFYEEPEVKSHECSMMGHVRIIYHCPILANLRKPANNINFANRKYCLWIPKILSEWFDLVLSKGFEEVIILYFAVMVSPVDCFLEFQFLALAQALEVYHKTRDIMFCDKTLSTVAMSKVITRYLRFIDEIYHMIEDHVDMTKVDKGQLEKIRRKYKKYKQDTGAEIKDVYYISRVESVHSIYENVDFSPKAIKDSIREGEVKTNQILDEIAKTK